MHVTIVGASRFGVATAQQLLDTEHEVVLIDKDRDTLDELAETLDCGMIHGDGTLPSTLKDAYGDGSDALIALTNTDNVNILASVVGRSVGYKRVIPQIVRAELLSVVDALDLDDTITPHESVARSIVSALMQDSPVETDMNLQHDLRLVVHSVPEALDGTRAADLDLPEGARPIAVMRDNHETLVNADTTLHEGARMLLVVPVKQVRQVARLFEKD